MHFYDIALVKILWDMGTMEKLKDKFTIFLYILESSKYKNSHFLKMHIYSSFSNLRQLCA